MIFVQPRGYHARCCGLAAQAAIVFSVLVGAMGYLVQAYTARRAERAAADAAQEQQAADAARERLHQQMAAQIKRIDRALDDCSRPLNLELLAVQQGLIRQVDTLVIDMQASQPEAVAEMLRLSKPVVTVSEDGTKAVSSRSGRLVWDIATQTSGLLRVEENGNKTCASAAGCAITALFGVAVMSQPFACELPHAIVSCIASDPTSPLAHQHRLFVRHTLLPCMREVARLFRAHAALMELPPTEWLKTKFPTETWGLLPSSLYVFTWQVRTQMWEALLAEWDAGRLDTSMPGKDVGFPLGGLTAINNWALARGEGRQRELIGCDVLRRLRFDSQSKRLVASCCIAHGNLNVLTHVG
eukprot:SAG31_NODE_4781_length_2958_cov_1.822665_4_plen_356_part_00